MLCYVKHYRSNLLLKFCNTLQHIKLVTDEKDDHNYIASFCQACASFAASELFLFIVISFFFCHSERKPF